MGRRPAQLMVIIAFVVVLLAGVCVSAWGQGQIRLVVNGREVQPDVPPQVIYGRAMVPLRAVAEALGADVHWDAETQIVTVRDKNLKALENINLNNALLGYLQWVASYFNGPDMILYENERYVRLACGTSKVSYYLQPVAANEATALLERILSYGDAYLNSTNAGLTWDAMQSLMPPEVASVEQLKLLIKESLDNHARIGLLLGKVAAPPYVVTEEDAAEAGELMSHTVDINRRARDLIEKAMQAVTDRFIRNVPQ